MKRSWLPLGDFVSKWSVLQQAPEICNSGAFVLLGFFFFFFFNQSKADTLTVLLDTEELSLYHRG